MFFSTYKRLAYVGMVVVPLILLGLFYAAFQSLDAAVGLTVLLTVILVPAQFFQLARLQTRLDDHDGSIPMSWVFDWDLEDDSADADSDAPDPFGARPAGRRCPACGFLGTDDAGRFCSRCGAPL